MKTTIKAAALVATLLLCTEAFANNQFIPNYYKNRRTQNHLSALGWSDRKEASLEYESSKTQEKTNGVDSGKTDTTELSGNIFYRANENFNVEFVASKEDEKPDASPTKVTNVWELGLGAQLSEIPMAFGLSYGSDDDDGDTTKTTALGVGYRLDNLFMGVGYSSVAASVSGVDSSYSHILVGGGYVWGDLKKPDAALEAVVQMYGGDNESKGTLIGINGLWNVDEAMQPYAGFYNFDKKGGTGEIKGPMFRLGVDYDFGVVYLSPEIISANLETGSGADSKLTAWSLEVGHRAEGAFEVFARYTSSDSKASATGTEFKDLTTGFTVGGTYFF